jgi:hypothetical protein
MHARNRRDVPRTPRIAGLSCTLALASISCFGALQTQAAPAAVAYNPAYTHNCRPVPDSFQIDGVLNEPYWKGLDTLRLVRNNDPAGGKPSVETLVFTAWSQTRLYVAFVAYSRNLRNTYAKHDDPIYEQDVVEMFIDPDGDSKNYFELEWTCLNTSLDYFFTGPRAGMDVAWTATGMQNAVKVMGTPNKASDTDTGMVAEISIPWSALKPQSKAALPPKAGDALPLDFFRIDFSNNAQGELIGWAPTGAADFHRPDKFGALIFSAQPVTSLLPRSQAPSRKGYAVPAAALVGAPRRADGRLAPHDARNLLIFRGPETVGNLSNGAARE